MHLDHNMKMKQQMTVFFDSYLKRDSLVSNILKFILIQAKDHYIFVQLLGFFVRTYRQTIIKLYIKIINFNSHIPINLYYNKYLKSLLYY